MSTGQVGPVSGAGDRGRAVSGRLRTAHRFGRRGSGHRRRRTRPAPGTPPAPRVPPDGASGRGRHHRRHRRHRGKHRRLHHCRRADDHHHRDRRVGDHVEDRRAHVVVAVMSAPRRARAPRTRRRLLAIDSHIGDEGMRLRDLVARLEEVAVVLQRK